MIDKRKVAQSFSRSAESYDRVAYLQRDVGSTLLSMLSDCLYQEKLNSVSNMLDLGCGTGFFRDKLIKLLPESQYYGVDIAEGMLKYCQQKSKSDSQSVLLCGDAEALPFCDQSVDVIFSNMALQWCENLPRLLTGLNSVLSDQGLVAITTLGPKTLWELKSAWAKVDELVHVNNFAADDMWRSEIEKNRFEIKSYSKKIIPLQFSSVRELLVELKLLGAHNINQGQRKSLTGRERLNKLFKVYPKDADNKFYPASYEVDFWVLKKHD